MRRKVGRVGERGHAIPIPTMFLVLLGILVLGGGNTSAATTKPPTAKGTGIVATVNGDAITLDEFNRELAALHRNAWGEKGRSKPDREKLLQRLVDARLVVQEGKRMGLSELQEVRNLLDVYGRVTLREHLIEKHAGGIRPVDKEVERLYKMAIVEWKVSSISFSKEDDAKQMVEALKAGKSFDELSKNAVEAGTAKQGDQGQYVRAVEVNPEIAKAVSAVKPGSVSPVILLKSGYAIVRLEDIRHVDNPEEKEDARRQALQGARTKALKGYNESLVKRYVKIHKEVLDKVDYAAKEPGFEALLKDERVVADVAGESSITVAELTQQLRQQFYHGVDREAVGKKLNAKKMTTLDEMLYKRVFRKEALRLGLDKTERYKNQLKDYENSVLFGAFIQKAVAPDVKLKEEDVKAYYEAHIKDYTLPEMMRVRGVPFARRPDAEDAIAKLRAGTDFRWLMENADGQVEKGSKDLLTFDGKLLTTDGLPEGVRKVVSGSKGGDLRLYASPEGYFYALSIDDVIPARPKPYEETREEIAKKIFDEKLKKAMEEYIAKLRAAAEIKIYLKQ
jgi:hypothetical protein